MDIFKKTLRETALLYSLTAAALTYTTAQACADGQLQNCYCAKEMSAKNRHKWQWGGCGDNVKDSRKITRKFLQLHLKGGDGPDRLFKFNSKIGLKTVAENEMKVCTCHGVSASCALKTCWKRLKPFHAISEVLKGKYHNAVRLPSTRNFQKQILKLKDTSNLIYLAHSPNFCATTSGRICADPDNCATLCCARGYNHQLKTIRKKCKYRWHSDTLTVKFEICKEDIDMYTCK